MTESEPRRSAKELASADEPIEIVEGSDNSSEDSRKRDVKLVCPKCKRSFFDFGQIICPDDGCDLEAADNVIGTCFAGRYQIIELLGRGGMSTVYKAQHLFMDKIVAVKILHTHLGFHSQAVRRFQQEAKTAGSLSHPSIVTVHDFGLTEDGRMFLVMDCVEGCSLADEIDEHGTLATEVLLPWILQVLDGLKHAHGKGVLHRDLKPSNIILTVDENGSRKAKIIDFGIAKIVESDGVSKLTQTGEIFGSPPYMSPEQCKGEPLDFRSDIYSTGCMMYEALSGSPPFVGANALVTMSMHASSSPESLRTHQSENAPPIWLDEIILKTLEKNPKARYQSADELSVAIQDGIEGGAGFGLNNYQAVVFRLRRMMRKASSGFRLALLCLASMICLGVFAFGVVYIVHEPTRASLRSMYASLQFSQHYKKGIALMSEAEFAEAIKELGAAIKAAEATPDKLLAYEQICKSYEALGNYIEADKVRKDAFNLKNRFVRSQFGMTEKQFTELSTRLVNMPPPKDAGEARMQALLFYEEACNSLLVKGESKIAREILVRALKNCDQWLPDDQVTNLRIQVALGVTYATEQDVASAERIWKAAEKYQDEHHMPLTESAVYLSSNLGRVEQVKGNNSKAGELFEKSFSIAKQYKSQSMLKYAFIEYCNFLRATGQKALLDKVTAENNQEKLVLDQLYDFHKGHSHH